MAHREPALSAAAAGPVAFVGDSHLLPGDGSASAFCDFVASAPSRFSRLVLVGDIFDLWLAREHLHEPHHRLVLDALRSSRDAGLPLDYVVGNRDYGVEGLPHSPFERVAPEWLAAPGAAPAWVAEHGDLVNTEDRQYRAWRAFSRSAPVLGSFLALPGSVGIRASQWLERRMRTTNLAYKRRIPEEHARRRAAELFGRTGARLLVLGHFHQELRLEQERGSVLILPDWKRSRRHAEWDPETDEARFADS